MKLVTEAGAECAPGTMLHMTHGPSIGQAWRYERVAPRTSGEHHVCVSRCHPRVGRVSKEFHPRIFGCEVVVDVKIYADRQRIMGVLHAIGVQAIGLTAGGIVAWIVAEYLSRHYGG